jgi:tetratricopeptide (TPR) repeat protein
MSGYMNMDMGQLDKAKMYFEITLEYFPESANAHDSMADYYEAKGDFANALKFVKKAFELSASDYYKERMEGLKLKN